MNRKNNFFACLLLAQPLFAVGSGNALYDAWVGALGVLFYFILSGIYHWVKGKSKSDKDKQDDKPTSNETYTE